MLGSSLDMNFFSDDVHLALDAILGPVNKRIEVSAA